MYMLDTDTCGYVLKSKSAKLAKRFIVATGKIAISEIVLAELRFGADNHQNRTAQIHDLIDDFIVRLEVIPWAASVHYGKLRARLQSSGSPIGNMDTLIAAHALSQNSILVSNNTRHFRRVTGLKVENWL